MKITYDAEADAAYISFKKEGEQVTTIRINDDVAVDLGEGEEIVGIEVLSASENLGLSKKFPEIKLENVKAA